MILSAKPYVEQKIKELKERVSMMDETPTLAIIQVEGDPASDRYVTNKMKKCAEVGIAVEHYYFGKNVDSFLIEEKISDLNADDDVTGILLQLPLPPQLDEHYLTNLIKPNKDVDGFTELNMGRLALGVYGNEPCTPKGVMELLRFYNIPVQGKDVLIINRSNIVGKPLAMMMTKQNATVTLAHSKTARLRDKIARADIIVTGVGQAGFLDERDVKNGAVIIDISINFNEEGKMCGDLDKECYDLLAGRCDFTPVPGGVGQTTVMALIDNLIEISERF